MSSTVLYFTQEIWEQHTIGSLTMFYGSVIKVLNRYKRPDLGDGTDYFGIEYTYVG